MYRFALMLGAGSLPSTPRRRGVMARYVAKAQIADKTAGFGFDEWELAKRYAHSLPKGTLVEITDTQAPSGKSVTYLITAGMEQAPLKRQAT
jgi:hypothetical protein